MVTDVLPELGFYALILALGMAVLQTVVPLWGAWQRRPLWMAFAQPMAWGQCTFLVLSLACLATGFYVNDFSVDYIAANSNSALPWYYRLSAVWGSHEGSMLLWSLLLSFWGLAVSLFSRRLPRDLLARVLGIMGAIGSGFLLFILVTSNPFTRTLPVVPAEGADLNPLLQDPGLIVHPPMLYMGYVGFSVAFAFAMAALLGGRLDAAWTRWARPWTTVAWSFLTLGIALGSWWAYYELGWGGWWFWDPVENASLMPWLVGTALMHSLAATEKRGTFKSWTVLLAIFSFSLSLLGTFLVRSGVLTSVHSFANDPDRGVFILVLLGLTVGLALLVFALRAPQVKSRITFGWLSRDTFLLINNIVLLVMAVTVLLGTLYPLLLSSLGLGKISVGPPYFNALFVPLATLLCIAMGLGPLSRWKQMSRRTLVKRSAFSALAALVLSVALPLWLDRHWTPLVSLGLLLALWVALASLREVAGSLLRFGLRGPRKLSRSHYGMVLGHLGLAVTITGITLVSSYHVSDNVRLNVGQQVMVGGYRFTMTSLGDREGPNYTATRATLQVTRDNRLINIMHPEKRFYHARRQALTETALDAGLFRDVYVAMGEQLDNGDWALRIQIKPFVRWIWLGGVIMALGGGLAVWDRRYRRQLRKEQL
ncbi:heme lyase CcmF/NrfE family subunit [Larsenimonas rhizosphaerae]|uniref:Heme lyase CcmF/NrfE family subunit n=1 Tax=Larsenimonas rhizosphaerae TaxID=2944682 RepID=A0AA41ZJJ3_9GAMM|nr:heme lyase CcmF/NrfE family subunit [Larsenimonas rhizosphaerae]MCX2522703.1 heme lyase CcmF/NrfE family subunit [Larsenimonas rhizosphaerae]